MKREKCDFSVYIILATGKANLKYTTDKSNISNF